MVEVEGVVARDGAVETRFEVGCPAVTIILIIHIMIITIILIIMIITLTSSLIILITLPIAELVLAPLVILAHSCNPRVDALKQAKINSDDDHLIGKKDMVIFVPDIENSIVLKWTDGIYRKFLL